MIDILLPIWENPILRKLILTALVLVGQALGNRVVQRLLVRRIPVDNPALYTVRRVTRYAFTLLAGILILGLWLERTGDLSVALGILGAGLAFALQEVIGSFAGWITIITGRPFSVGDRIETSGIRGDVVDIGILRTTLMETGNWLNGDHNTGRIVTVSNAFIFKEPLYNSSAYLNFVWDEITLPVTYDSDWKRAINLMSASINEHESYQALLPRAEEQRIKARRSLAVKLTSLAPRVFVRMTDNWIELGMVYPVDHDNRRKFRSEVSQRILLDFERNGIQLGSQTISIVDFPH